MKALKIQLFQQTACYKKPFMLKVNETYPLPPYSTINGLLHAILDAKEYIDFNISVQGTHEGILADYQTTYFYKESGNHTSMPLYRHALFNVNLIIHIAAEDRILENLYSKFFDYGFFTLGRNEDLVRIDSIKYVDIDRYSVEYFSTGENNSLREYKLKNSIYLPLSLASDSNMNGIQYKLNTHYTNDARKDKKRVMNTVNMMYVEADECVMTGDVLLDNDGDIVSFFK